MFIIFAGLPGTGKSTIAENLAYQLDATYLRIDSIEQAILETGAAPAEAGYLVGFRIAADNLRLGRTVIADSVNPLKITRDAYRQVANEANAAFLEIEIICSDKAEHRSRVETRQSTVAGLALPGWEQVERRIYEIWDREWLQIATAKFSIAGSVKKIIERLNGET